MATKRQCGQCPEEGDPKRVHKITDFFSTGSHSCQSSSESPLITVSVSQSSVSDDHDFIISQRGEELTSIADVIKCIISLKSGMPNIVSLLIIAATIAVSSATCERSFSSMKRIKTYLRSTMGQQRLQDVSILSIDPSKT